MSQTQPVLSNPNPSRPAVITVIRPRRGPRINLHELLQYQELLIFLVLRDIKARYAQSVLGVGWAIIQPLFSMIVFTIVFGRIAKIDADGLPYPIFSFAGLVLWTSFSNSLVDATGSLIRNSHILTKIYFPRLIMPLAPVLGRLLDFGIALVLLFAMILWFGVVPGFGALLFPLFVLLMVCTAAGLGLWLAGLAIQFRDVSYGIPFVVQLLMYAAPVVYPTTLVPDRFRLLYSLNPMVGAIEGFRASLFGLAVPWDLVAVGAGMAALLIISGVYFFQYRESIFADVA
ncbi:MAG: ABC transporter permease [Acidobacteria bacterium]|nr:MAG: ABC transporter permease [Acidobacteriota bacterium]